MASYWAAPILLQVVCALLKLRGLTASPGKIRAECSIQAKLAPWLSTHGKALAPVVKWLVRHVG